MSHLSLTEREREKGGGREGGRGEGWVLLQGLKSNHRREMSYLHISKIHHRTAIKGPVNTVLHIERNFHCFSESAVYVQF